MRNIITFPMFDGKKDWYVFVFTVRKFTGNIIESIEGNLMWVDDNDLTDLNLWDGDRIFMKWLEKKEFFSAKFIYKNKKLISHEVNFYPFKS